MLALVDRSFNFLLHTYRCPTFELSSLPAKTKGNWTIPPLPDEIWLEIFEFATYLYHAKTIAPLNAFTPARTSNNAMAANTPYLTSRTKCALVLVCRSWRRIALRLLYEHISIPSLRRAKLVLAALQGIRQPESSLSNDSVPARRGPGHGQWTRHLEIHTHTRGTMQYLQATFEIMKLCPKLHTLSGDWSVPLPNEYLLAISKLYGSSLKGLYWSDIKQGTPIATPEFLSSFRALCVLDLRDFEGNEESMLHPPSVLPSLPRLHTIVLSSRPRCPLVASILVLPALENITIEMASSSHIRPQFNENLSKMLAVHGKIITSIDIIPPIFTERDTDDTRYTTYIDPSIFLQPGTCPNLQSLTFPQSSPQCTSHVHPGIRRIGLRGIKSDYLYPNKASHTKDHLMSINRELYPNLEVVRTVGFLVDSCGDSLIKDIFIWWAERFEAQGIDFQDGEGVVWLYSEPEPEPSTLSNNKSSPIIEQSAPN